MVAESRKEGGSRFKAWCQKWLASVVLLLIVLSMLVWIGALAVSDTKDKPTWLLVPITVIYAVITLAMAAAAFQNAAAARRSAQAMEASVDEQRQSRWAEFAAIVTFPDGWVYRVQADGSATVVLGNAFQQPMLHLQVRLWQMEGDAGGAGLIKYSTMMESTARDVSAQEAQITIQLRPTSLPEAERVRIANFALERFRSVNRNGTPQSALCLITYSHRAHIGDSAWVYDLKRVDVQS